MGGDAKDEWIAETLAVHEKRGDTIDLDILRGILSDHFKQGRRSMAKGKISIDKRTKVKAVSFSNAERALQLVHRAVAIVRGASFPSRPFPLPLLGVGR